MQKDQQKVLMAKDYHFDLPVSNLEFRITKTKNKNQPKQKQLKQSIPYQPDIPITNSDLNHNKESESQQLFQTPVDKKTNQIQLKREIKNKS